MSEETVQQPMDTQPPIVINGEPKKNDFFDIVLEPPNWLNKDFLEKCLKDYENDKTLLVTECSIVPATKPGDNFASIVFRAILTITSKNWPAPGENLNLIIKVKPFHEGLKKEMMADTPLFETEIEMYTKVLPEMQRLLSQTGDSDIIAPNIIHHGLNPDYVIFEDISKFGYIAKHDALNYNNTLKVITKLAKIHALSYYIQNESILDLSEFNQGFLNSAIADKIEFIPQSFSVFVEAVKEYGNCEVIVEKLSALQPVFMKTMSKVYKPNPTGIGFNVLNHGDFHIRNLMFTFNSDDIDRVSFIDFQISFWGTPAIDLYYVFYAIASNETREKQQDLLRAYHDKFCSILSDLGYLKKPPSLLDIHIELLRYGLLEVLMASCFLPIFFINYADFAEEMKDLKLDEWDAMKEFQKKIYKEENFKSIVEKLLFKFLHTGLLDM